MTTTRLSSSAVYLLDLVNRVSAVVLEDMVLISRRLEDLKKSLDLGLEQKVLGLGLDGMVLILVLVFKLKSCNFQDLQLFFYKELNCAQFVRWHSESE
jgi:hypothetical protein